MRYLITTKSVYEPFFSDYFNAENNFNIDLNMIVYDLQEKKFTIDGELWWDIEVDHL